MKRIVLIALMVSSAAFAVELGGFGGPSVTGMLIDFGDLNAELNKYNTNFYGGSQGPELTSPVFMIGGEGAGTLEGFSVGGWGAGFFQDAHGDSSKVMMGYGMGYGEFGYSFKLFNVLRVRPLVEVGGGGIGLNISRYKSGGFGDPSDTGTSFFDDNSYNLGKGFVNIGGAAEIALLLPMDSKGYSFGGLSLKIGYLYTVWDSGWFDQHGGSYSEPATSLQGPFASLSALFGGSVRFLDNGTDEEDGWEDW